MALTPQIKLVRTYEDLASLRTLFAAYARSLPISLDYQDFAGELAGLPGKYAAPEGELFLALGPAGEALGCGAFRPLFPGLCEMKRLYVAPEGRGTGLGRHLANLIMETAKARGYGEIRLDTLPGMTEAQALYQSLGFRETRAYYAGAAPGTLFLARPL